MCETYDCGPKRWKCYQGNNFQCIDLNSRFLYFNYSVVWPKVGQSTTFVAYCFSDAMESFTAAMLRMNLIANIILKMKTPEIFFYSFRLRFQIL